MSDFKDFLNERDIIHHLMKWYGISLEDSEVKDLIYRMVENISDMKSNEIESNILSDNRSFNLDTMARSYEKLVPHSQRKTMGEFFTPIQIVDYILMGIGYTEQQDIENKKLIDLSCGSGSFLIIAINVLLNKLRWQIKSKDNSELTPKEAKEIINKVKANISGIDINLIACILC